MEQEIAALIRAIQAQNATFQTLVELVAEIKPVVVELKEWKPAMIASVDDLRGEVGELRDQVKQMARDAVPVPRAARLPPLLPTLEHLKIKETKEEGGYDHEPNGQCASTQNRGKAMGNHTP